MLIQQKAYKESLIKYYQRNKENSRLGGSKSLQPCPGERAAPFARKNYGSNGGLNHATVRR
jgi:hypothetical protein